MIVGRILFLTTVRQRFSVPPRYWLLHHHHHQVPFLHTSNRSKANSRGITFLKSPDPPKIFSFLISTESILKGETCIILPGSCTLPYNATIMISILDESVANYTFFLIQGEVVLQECGSFDHLIGSGH